jgi:hypothetical protein
VRPVTAPSRPKSQAREYRLKKREKGTTVEPLCAGLDGRVSAVNFGNRNAEHGLTGPKAGQKVLCCGLPLHRVEQISITKLDQETLIYLGGATLISFTT